MRLDVASSQQSWPAPTTSGHSRRKRSRLPRALLAVLLLLSLTSVVSAQDGATQQLPTGIDNKTPEPAKKKDDEPQPAITAHDSAPANFTAPPPPEPAKDEPAAPAQDEFLKDGKPRLHIDSISPAHGPTTGDTKVVVRGGPFAQYQQEHPEPKCKFGDQAVAGAYVPCPPRQPKVYEREGSHHTRTSLCIQCENSPPLARAETTNVTFTISLDGTFEDVKDSTEFWYYKPVKVSAIKPSFGPKDGGTTVQVWGEHFFDFGDDSVCSFGVKSVPAKVVNEGYITCVSPGSDVVGRGMPFSISLNGQQQSREQLDFWFYNDPQVTMIEPDTGPEKGGNVITLRGENFKPFHVERGEIDISNSTFCYFVAMGQYRKATISNTTKATCKAPESYYFTETAVEITLNAEDRTDDGNLYHYYKPPFLFDAEPNQGPTKGGTKVKVAGSNFTDTGNITCRFGEKTVPATRLSSSEITCVSPPQDHPGEVDLVIQVYAGLDSASVSFLYYKAAEVRKVSPSCGPMSGYTQIAVIGENFIDLGRDQINCAFKQEDTSSQVLTDGSKTSVLLTNASIINSTFAYCDTPSLVNKQGYIIDGGEGAWFDVYISLDGGSELSDSNGRFEYYSDPFIYDITPALGPQTGGTVVTVNATGFDQNTTCGIYVRLGLVELTPSNITNETLTFVTPRAAYPGTSAVSFSMNGQQFTKQQVASDLDKELTFDYYEAPYTTFFYPARGPSSGANYQRHQGFGYMLGRPHISDRLWVRLLNSEGMHPVTEEIEIPSDNLHIDEWYWYMPAVNASQAVLMQISLNQQQWHDVSNLESPKSYEYYEAPHITGISPTYGHVKKEGQVIEISGTGFTCLNEESCKKDIKCRFGNSEDDYIYVAAERISNSLIKCHAPAYTRPDVLKVEMTINGESYTNDNHTFGYADPYVYDANPKLIAVDGSTEVQVKGIGFVDSGHCKIAYKNNTYGASISCGGSDCHRNAKFIDKNTMNSTSFPQAEVKYESGNNVLWDPMVVEASVQDPAEFSKSQVEVFYYEEPAISEPSINESPANLQSQIILGANFKNNDRQRLMLIADPKCRFTAGGKTYVEEGQLIAYPFTDDRNPDLINSIHCKSPRWQLEPTESAEQARLDVSLNGQNWFGNLNFQFTKELRIHRDAPMAQPNANASAIKFIGQGYRLRGRTPSVKWGLQTTEAINMSSIKDYTYTHDSFLGIIPNSVALKAYEVEAARWPRVDTPLAEGQQLDLAELDNRLSDNVTEGVAYIEAGIDEVLKREKGDPWTLYTYEPSSVEFYAFRVPNVLKIFPTAGFTKGGTLVEVLGTWFDYQPQYGIVPHCKFGNTVVRAHFDSTVRLVCPSPPSPGTNARLDFEVSLNGIDWTYTNFTFAYLDEPTMTQITPNMGSIEGGEVVYILGDKFSNHTDPEYFKCRFTPTTLQLPPKESQVEYLNSSAIRCPAPGGWPQGDNMIVQVTQNGIDWDDHHFEYSYYSVHRAFPRSGPSDGKGGVIVVSGEGFKPAASPRCRMNGTESTPLQVTHDTIKCAIPPAEGGKDYYGNVDFAISPNGGASWYPFDGGFQYYEQPTVEDIDPKMGPSDGTGIINFYGDNFRADYALAELGCKVGSAKGKAQYVSERQIKCIVENMPLPAEDQESLPAVVSLNSYSYTVPTEKTVFRPYGIRQLSPNSGPVGGITTVIVQGQGFSEEPGVNPRCRFGTPANYAIVDAEVLSYTRLACRTPDFLPLTQSAALPRDVPFSIALSSDEFDPWTKTSHVFRFYDQPQLEAALPSQLEVGRIGEVYLKAAEGSEFFEPMALQPNSEKGTQSIGGSSSMSGMRCKFGRFGEASAIYINETHIKCTTPPYDEGADTIYKESAPISVAINGVDFADDQSAADFTFTGTAPYISFITILLLLAAIAFLAYAGAMLIEQYHKKKAAEGGDAADAPPA